MYIMWWGGAILCMNTAYELTQNFLQDCDQDTFFLNVLTVLCIYQFPEIFPENISKIFVSASCCFIVYEKSNSRLTLNTVLEKQEWQSLYWLEFKPRSWVLLADLPVLLLSLEWIIQLLPLPHLSCLKPWVAKTWSVPNIQLHMLIFALFGFCSRQSWRLSRRYFRSPCQSDTAYITSLLGEEDHVKAAVVCIQHAHPK